MFQFRSLFISFLFLFIFISSHVLNSYAHSPFPAYIEHQISLLFSLDYIDATVRFTFFKDEAKEVRQRIDANQDKAISELEYKSFVEQIANQRDWLKISFNQEPLKLVMLYDPAFDNFQSDRMNQTTFSCDVSFFAEKPKLQDSNVLIVEDAFMPQTPAVCIFNATAASGEKLDQARYGDMSGPLPFKIASPNVNRASRTFELMVTKKHFVGE